MVKQTNTIREWRLLADDDLDVADYLAENKRPVPTAIIAFHCQQAVEKYLKGVLTFFEEDMHIVLSHTKPIKGFIEKEVPEFLKAEKTI